MEPLSAVAGETQKYNFFIDTYPCDLFTVYFRERCGEKEPALSARTAPARMPRKRIYVERFHVAAIIDFSRRHERKILEGIAAYAKEGGQWSFYVEADSQQKLPDLRVWRGDGIIASFQDRKVAVAVEGLAVPMVDVGGGPGWYDPSLNIPWFSTDNKAIARLAADHLHEHISAALPTAAFPARGPITGPSSGPGGPCRVEGRRRPLFGLYRPLGDRAEMARGCKPA